jgi:hypothetical protein
MVVRFPDDAYAQNFLSSFRLQRLSGFLFTMICPHFLASGAQGPQRLRRSTLRALVCELASAAEFGLMR